MAHGFTVQGGLGAGASVIPHDSSAHSVLVPDTELLFTAQFHRAGPDLVLTGRDGQHHLVPDYFSSEHHPALVAPNGAHLSPATVDLLAGSPTPGHYAQAQPTASPDSIGRIEKVIGDVTVVRNGVTVALHVGDAVFKSDVVQTGASSSCGISFPDGTALNLVANTRMALNDYAYDASSNANGALFTLVEGTFAFVAGKVAHTGDMKIATPVATMGIRGTTGVIEEVATITATSGQHTYTFAVVPDIGTGITGVWDCYLTDAAGNIVRDANGNPIVLATVSQSGYVTYLTPQGIGLPPLVTTEPVTNSQYAFEQDMLQQLFLTLNPLNQPNGNNGSSTPPPPFELPNPIPQLFEDSNKPFTINVPNGSNPTAPTTIDITGPTGPLTVVIWIANGNGLWGSGPSWLGASTPSSPQEVIIPDYKVTTDGADSAAGLVVEINSSNPTNPGILNIVSGTSFTIYDFIHGNGTVQLNASGADPTLFIHGGVTLVGDGTINMIGTAGQDFILGVPSTGALLINVDYTIEGTGTIGGGDGNLTFENFGTVNANNGLLTINTGNQVYNDGLMEATVDPLAATLGTLQIKDSVANAGTVLACGTGAAVTLSGATFDNLFSVVAKNGGSVTFTNVAVTNEAVSTTDPTGGTINANGGTIAFDGGSLANGNLLEATNGGILQLENLTVTNSSAATASVDLTSTLDLASAAILGGTIDNAGNVVVTDGASVLHGDGVTNDGTMTVEADASLTLEGDTTLINEGSGLIKADGGTVAIELDTDTNVNSGTIEAVNGGEVDFYINVEGGSNHGLIEAGAGGTVHFFDTHGGGGGGGGGAQGGNYGTMEATDGGVLIFDGGLDNFYLVEALNGGLVYLNDGIKNHAGTVEAVGSDSVTAVTTAITISGGVINDATIEATGFGAQINIADSDSSENAATILAENHGTITLSSVQLENDQGATVEANRGTINFFGGTITNDGTFKSDHQGAIFVDSHTVYNDGTGVFEALSDGLISFGEGTVYNGVAVSAASGGTIEALQGGSVEFATTTVYNGSSVAGTAGGAIQASCGGTVSLSLSCTIYNNNDAGGPGGLIEALRGGTVDIDTSTVFNDNGLIEAIGCGAVVALFGTDIYGGTLASSDGGVIEATDEGSVLDDVTILGGSVLQAVNNGFIGIFQLDDITTLAGGTVTFEGGGEFAIGGETPEIVALTAGTTLMNASTIEGAGQIGAGDGKLTLDNQSGGVVDADLRDFTLTIDTGNTVDNCGLLEATSCGTLSIADSVDNYAHSFIEADSGTVYLTGGYTNYGTIEATDCGVVNISIVDNNGLNYGIIEALDGTVNITSTGYGGNHGLVMAGAGGTINVNRIDSVSNPNGGNFGTYEATDGGAVNFTGSGTNYGTDKATGSGSTITFDLTAGDATQTNEGGTMEALCGGAIVVNGGTLYNDYDSSTDTAATIDASRGGSVTVNGGTTYNNGGSIIEALSCGIVTFDDSATIHNATGATIEALCGGTVDFNGVTVDNSGGTIAASGHDAVVNLFGATINGGTLETSDCGIIENPSGTSTLSGVTIDDGSILETNDCTFIDLEGITTLNGTVTFEGGGIFVLDCGVASIVGGSGGGTLDIAVGATLTGPGDIGNDTTALTLNNSGTVEATCGDTLTIDANLDNSNSVTASYGGTIQIDGNVHNESSGEIGASSCGTITFTDDCIVNASDGSIGTMAGGTVTFDGSHITNCGLIGANGGTVTIEDSCVQNFGALIDCVFNGIEADNGGKVTIDCSNVTSAGIIAAQDDGTICITYSCINNSGGTSDDGNGIAAYDGGSITIKDSSITNTGFIRAFVPQGDDSTAGTIAIDDSTVHNAGGSITAIGAGAAVDLSNTTIYGGTLATDDEGGGTCGLIEIVSPACNDSNTTIFNGVDSAVTVDAFVKVDAGAALELLGQIDNNGTIDVDGPPPTGADLVIDGTVALCGSGVVTLDGSGDEITGINDGTLKNFSTIEGAGSIGNAALSLTNECNGVIDATGGLTVNLVTNTLTNRGLMEATGGGELSLLSPVLNYGVIAAYAGSTVCIGLEVSNIVDLSASGQVIASGHCAVVDLVNAVVGGGTVESDCGGLIQTVAGLDDVPTRSIFDDVIIGCGSDVKVADLTALVLEAGTTMSGGTLSIESSGGVEIVNGGGTGGATLTNVTLDNCGEVTVDGNTTLTLSGTTVHGGAIDGTDVSTGDLVASTIDITGDSTFCDVIVSDGDLTVESDVTLTLNNATLDGVTVMLAYDADTQFGANLQVDGTVTLDDGTTITGNDTGTLTIDADNTLDIEHGGGSGPNYGATLDGVNVTDNGALDVGNVASGAILTLDDGTAITGNGTGTLTINANNTLDVEHGSNFDSGGATLDGVNVTDNGALDIGEVDSGAILTLDDGTTITGNGTGTLSINANNTLDVERGGGPNYGATLDGVDVTDNGAIVLGEFSSTVLTLDDGTTIGGGGAGTLTIYADSTLDVEQGANDNPPYGAVFDGVNVTDDGTIVVGEFSASGTTLILDDGTTVSGTGSSALIIDAGSTLDIERGSGGGTDHGATLEDVKVNDNRAIVVGEFSASGATLTLEDGTAIKGDDIGTLTIYANSTLDVENGGSGGGATLDGVLVTDNGALDIGDVISGATLALEDDTTISGSGTMTINAADTLNVDSGTTTIDLGGIISNAGTLEATGGGELDINSAICNTGALTADEGTLDVAAAVGGTGSATIADDGILEFQSCVSAGQTVTFSDTTGTLAVGDAADFHASIAGLAAGDKIDLTNMVVTSEVWNGSTLTLNDGAAVLNIASIPSGDAFYFSSDGASGTDIRLYAAPVLSAPQAGGSASNFVTIDDPSTTHSSANGINDSGTIVGSGALDANNDTGWEYNGTFSLIGVAGAQDSDVNGINDSGEIAGFYSPVRSTPRYGFVDNGGTYSQINVPPGVSTTANINDNGVVVGGSYLHTVSGVTPVYTGFIDDNGTITYLNAPGTLTSNGYTYAYGINDSGQVVGDYETSYSSGQQHGFLYDNGTFTTIDDPNAGSGGTYATGINNSGIIVGTYSDSSGLSHGFVDINGTFTTVDDPLGAKGTQINGINNAGQIVGDYIDSNNVEHGFVASLNGVSTAEDRALTLTSLSVSDAGSGSNPILVTLDVGHGTLTLSDVSGLSVSGQGTDDLSLTGTASAIAAALAAGVIYAPTLGYAYADVLTLTANDQGHNATGTPLSTTQDVGIVITPEISIANGGSYEVTGSSADTIAFAGDTGTLALDQPSNFTGVIAGSFAIGDTIDLAGFSATDTATTGAGSFNSATDETTLTVRDSGGNVVETIALAGDHSSSSWTVTSDSHGGIDIVDPPASGAKDASSAVTAGSGNNHTTAPATQNGTDHAVGAVNEAGFGSDQASAAAATAQDGTAAPPANQLVLGGNTVTAPPSAASALGDSDLAAFGSDHVAVPPAGPAAGGVDSGAATITNVASAAVVTLVAPNTPVLDSEHVTDSTIVDGSGAANGEVTSSTPPTTPDNAHAVAPVAVTSPPPAASPTLASATFGASGNDSFAFHPNLGSDTASITHANELAHSSVQVGAPALGSTALEFHQELAFDVIHQDDTHLAATVDQFHQMAANSTLLH